MSKDQLDMFEQPPTNLARAHSAEEVHPNLPAKEVEGHQHYRAAHELVHYTDYLKLNDWQQKVLWPHLQVLLERMRVETRADVQWFELGYIISAMEIEQLRSRAAAMLICKKYGVEI